MLWFSLLYSISVFWTRNFFYKHLKRWETYHKHYNKPRVPPKAVFCAHESFITTFKCLKLSYGTITSRGEQSETSTHHMVAIYLVGAFSFLSGFKLLGGEQLRNTRSNPGNIYFFLLFSRASGFEKWCVCVQDLLKI